MSENKNSLPPGFGGDFKSIVAVLTQISYDRVGGDTLQEMATDFMTIVNAFGCTGANQSDIELRQRVLRNLTANMNRKMVELTTLSDEETLKKARDTVDSYKKE